MRFEDSDSDEPTRRTITEKQNQQLTNDIYMLKKSCCRMSKRIVFLENFIKFKFDDFPLEKDNIRSFPKNDQNSRNQKPKRKTVVSNLKTFILDRDIILKEGTELTPAPDSGHTDFQIENTYSVRELENSQETINENNKSLKLNEDSGQQEEYNYDEDEGILINEANDKINYSAPSPPKYETEMELEDESSELLLGDHNETSASEETSQNPLTAFQKKNPKVKGLKVCKPLIKKRGQKKKYYDRPIRSVTCKECNKEFIGKWAGHTLKRHMEMHVTIKKYLCKHCGRAFAYKSSLNSHEKRIHEKEQNLNFVCQYCPQRFLYVWDVTKHERLKHTGELVEFSCDRDGCDFKTTFEAGLQYHQKTVHPHPEKPSFCPYCGEKCSSRQNMKLHIKNEHVEDIEIGADGKRVKNAKCDICEATFSGQKSLARHKIKKPKSCKPREQNQVISIVDEPQDNENANEEEIETLTKDEISSIPDNNGKPDEQFSLKILRKKESLKKPVKFGEIFDEVEEDNDSNISLLH